MALPLIRCLIPGFYRSACYPMLYQFLVILLALIIPSYRQGRRPLDSWQQVQNPQLRRGVTALDMPSDIAQPMDPLLYLGHAKDSPAQTLSQSASIAILLLFAIFWPTKALLKAFSGRGRNPQSDYLGHTIRAYCPQCRLPQPLCTRSLIRRNKDRRHLHHLQYLLPTTQPKSYPQQMEQNTYSKEQSRSLTGLKVAGEGINGRCAGQFAQTDDHARASRLMRCLA
ncbi:hypothetical protein EJ05DRAFT_10984 [Pseudovirgaria hyperparasitica]|uniref:Uncharacterized protein n=1 Tax=Pseudovirgaria hyperparasitica TaxID=470096 RepID=A0A6A6WKK9_9PEZI|nr:uncharacterized protein EJ05DRAFT_10984 [Pseudovirgaria hyperparasitica]KAF2762734.1 hypothetical protein EJ05DRAFT_10984 [Pseudovirgaria hyperparasitica]